MPGVCPPLRDADGKVGSRMFIRLPALGSVLLAITVLQGCSDEPAKPPVHPGMVDLDKLAASAEGADPAQAGPPPPAPEPRDPPHEVHDANEE